MREWRERRRERERRESEKERKRGYDPMRKEEGEGRGVRE